MTSIAALVLFVLVSVCSGVRGDLAYLDENGGSSGDRAGYLFQMVMRGSGKMYSSCPGAYTVYDCGIINTQNQNQTNYDRSRYAWPLNNKTCECYDKVGAACVAFCRSIVLPGYEIKNSTFTAKEGSVQCSPGKRVLSCNVKGTPEGQEAFKKAYPADDGTGCKCYDGDGGQCAAVCANPLPAYAIFSKTGSGPLQVGCLPGQALYGCGTKPGSADPPDNFPVRYASTANTCVCSYKTGLTCYAMCAV